MISKGERYMHYLWVIDRCPSFDGLMSHLDSLLMTSTLTGLARSTTEIHGLLSFLWDVPEELEMGDKSRNQLVLGLL